MITVMDLLIALLLFLVLVLLLGPAHRRSSGLPHAPFGADADHVHLDHDLDRVRHDALVRGAGGAEALR